jgi:hypothetical protein
VQAGDELEGLGGEDFGDFGGEGLTDFNRHRWPSLFEICAKRNN